MKITHREVEAWAVVMYFREMKWCIKVAEGVKRGVRLSIEKPSFVGIGGSFV